MIIHRIAPQKELQKLRVAAYARVSTGTEEQADSYETQVDYYTRLIRQNMQWEYIDVYADLAKTATSAKHRPEFQRMITDAKARKLDLLLVKSISRFARNVVDAQKYVHIMKQYDVEVRFENEAISSFDPASELMFNILAATAQQESKNKSENVRWAYQKRAEQGIRHIGNNRVMGYDEVNGMLTPNKDAWVVKMIFEQYANGISPAQIIKNLETAGAKRLRCDKPFEIPVIMRILSNEIYAGDRLLQKQAPHHYLTKRPDPTISYKSHYIVGGHEPIIDRETWERVKGLLEQKKRERKGGIHVRGNVHFLYGLVLCAECGSPYKRRTITRGDRQFKVWNCAQRQKGHRGNGCRNRIIREDELLQTISMEMGWPWVDSEHFDRDAFAATVRRVLIGADGVKVDKRKAA